MKFYCSIENRGEPTSYITRPNAQLQGARPAALAVNKNPKKARAKKNTSPVIVYLISPKIIHVQPEEFMDMVQRLTGNYDHQALRTVDNTVANVDRSCSISSNSGY